MNTGKSPALGWQRIRRLLQTGPPPIILGLAIYLLLLFLLQDHSFSIGYFILGTMPVISCGYLFGHHHGKPINWFRMGLIVGGTYAMQAVLLASAVYGINQIFESIGGRGDLAERLGILYLVFHWGIILIPTTLAALKLVEGGKKPSNNLEGYTFFQRRLILLGTILTVLPAIGALIGYVYGYNKTLRKEEEWPFLHNLPPFIKRCMVIGGIIATVSPFVGFVILIELTHMGLFGGYNALTYGIMAYMGTNLLTTVFAWSLFRNWRSGMIKYFSETQRFGTARFARDKDLTAFDAEASTLDPDDENPEAIPPIPGHLYVGTREGRKYLYRKDSHLITVAGTRAGKGVNLLIPNLLDKSTMQPQPSRGIKTEDAYLKPEDAAFQGSWVIVDPKGEACWYTADHQAKMGRQVVALNPWHLVVDGSDTLNPLDLVKDDPERTGLADDLRVIAETIVPISQNQGSGSHFNDRARTLIMTMLMHLIVSPTYRDRITFNTLWEWFSDLDALLIEMAGIEEDNDGNPVQIDRSTFSANAAVVSNYALQFWQLRQQSEREYGSVISTAQRYMDIFSSRDLQQVMASSTSDGGKPFDLTRLAQDKICLYIILPPDKLKTHATWLRLIVASCLRAVLRKPGHRVGFILDEFYALGYLRDIDVGMGAYAGYGITLWVILQSMSQLRELYPRSWENFLANAAVTHAFGLNDVASLEYISKLAGQTSQPSYNQLGQITGATARPLMTPDEVRRGSDKVMFTFLDRKPISLFNFLPWFEDPEIKHRGNPKRLPDSSR